MTYGAEIWGPPLIQAAASVGSGLLGQGNQETKMQKTQRKLVDKLLASLNGSGPYSDLFNSDEDAFQKSFVEPAQARFRNQIAPQIQQQYIASGQQRGTGLDDTLTRAGVDLDSLLNENMYKFQQDALNRQQNSINSILVAGTGAANTPSTGQNALSGLSGYLSSQGFADSAAGFFKKPSQQPLPPERKGFENQ